jgi:hypothetical protein
MSRDCRHLRTVEILERNLRLGTNGVTDPCSHMMESNTVSPWRSGRAGGGATARPAASASERRGSETQNEHNLGSGGTISFVRVSLLLRATRASTRHQQVT